MAFGDKVGLRLSGTRVEGELVDELKPIFESERLATLGAKDKGVGLATDWRDTEDVETGADGGTFPLNFLLTAGFRGFPVLEEDRGTEGEEVTAQPELWEGFEPETLVGGVEERRLFGNHWLLDELSAAATVRL